MWTGNSCFTGSCTYQSCTRVTLAWQRAHEKRGTSVHKQGNVYVGEEPRMQYYQQGGGSCGGSCKLVIRKPVTP